MNKCRLLKRIPKASRIVAAEKLAQLLTVIVANPDNMQAWIDLFLFPSSCLKVPGGRGGRKHQKNLAGKINEVIRSFPVRPAAANHIQQCDNRVAAEHKTRNKSKRSEQERMAARVSELLEDGDVRGAVRLAASEETMAPYNQYTVDALISKHPRAIHHPQYTASDAVEPLQGQEADIAAAIKSFPAGSAAGLDGLRPQHLKDMVGEQTAAAGQQLLTRLTDFTNNVLSGHVPNVIRPVLCGASLCALSKKDGGIRPIAVGNTLRRLVAKVACSAVRDRVTERLAPLQLGFGVKQGAEAAAHAARCYVRNLGPGEALLKIDFANAFNTINRDEVFISMADYAPELLPFIGVCYGQPSFLCYGDHVIMSEVGMQQGVLYVDTEDDTRHQDKLQSVVPRRWSIGWTSR
jgi:hypothetical protein